MLNNSNLMGAGDHFKNKASSKKLMSGVISILLAIASIALISCDDEDKTVAVTGVTLSENTLSFVLGVDQPKTLTATVAPEDATNKEVTWSSSAPNVETVANGVVTAVSVGTATITVTTTDGARTAICAVTVNAPEVVLVSIAVTTQPTKK